MLTSQIKLSQGGDRHLKGDSADTGRAGAPGWVDAIPDEALRQIAGAWGSLYATQKDLLSDAVSTFLQGNDGRRQ